VFHKASAFNSDISAWDVGAVVEMSSSAPPLPILAYARMRVWSSHGLSLSRVAVCDGVVGNVPTTVGVCEGGGGMLVVV
jgi:surface protein